MVSLTVMLSRFRKQLGTRISFLVVLYIAVLYLTAYTSPSLLAGQKEKRTIKSEYSNKSVTVVIRQGKYGKQARLPRGTWIWCHGDCEEAVRHQYLDFWERQRELTAHIRP